jgi:hypothetical protein
MTNYKLIIYVPQTHLEQVRAAVCDAGAGKIGNYDNCAFMTSGIGTFMPLKGAKPFQGEEGKLERIGEARLEITVSENILKDAILAMRKVHPYEEPAYDVIRLEDY